MTRFLALMKYMEDHRISLYLGDSSEAYQEALRPVAFLNLINKICGEEYNYYMQEDEHTVVIVNQGTHKIVGQIVGRLDTAYVRRDTRYGVMHPYLYETRGDVYLKKLKVGTIWREDQIRHTTESIYFICSQGLCKYDLGGQLLWRTEIPANYIQNLRFDYNDCPSEEFPQGLIGISENEMFNKYMFYKNTGALYGTFKVKKQYLKEGGIYD